MQKFLLFMVVVFLLALPVTYNAFADVNKGIIAAWTFDDGTAKDSIGKNDGKINGGVEFVKGKFGKAASFNGKDGFISVPHNKSFEVIANGLTCSCWFNIRTGKDHSAMIFKGEMVGWTSNYAFRICTTSNTGMTWGVCIVGTEGYFATADVYATNQWYFACLTADGKQAIGHVASEKDGKISIPKSDQGNPHAIASPYRTCPEFPIEMGVGRAYGGTKGNDVFLDGIVDDIILWDRALTEDEIAELAKGKKPSAVLSVGANGKLSTAWGAIKSR